MTDRLYYSDPYNREFDAVVQRVGERGGRGVVWLDRTSFYPTSGGQPFDIGTLGPSRVVDVFEDEAGDVSHVVEPIDAGGARQDPLRPGETVRGVIDWTRRFDHMQQHSGQHLVSAAVERLFGVATVSFHLGPESSTIDLAREVSARDLSRAESEANRIVWEDRRIDIRFVSAEEAARLPLRRDPARAGTLRLIEIEDFDLSACGGTHVARTGAVGVIALTRSERFKGGQRVEFVCGARALERFRTLNDAVSRSVRLVSVLPGELPGAIEKLQNDARSHRRAVTDLAAELAGYHAEELAAHLELTPKGGLVLRVVEADADGLKTLAAALVRRPGRIAVLVSSASPAAVVVARSADVPIAASEILSRLIAQFGGKGGGRPDLAQGGGLVGPSDAILVVARARLNE
jgi:alanyl-tRNA synthetase